MTMLNKTWVLVDQWFDLKLKVGEKLFELWTTSNSKEHASKEDWNCFTHKSIVAFISTCYSRMIGTSKK